MSKKTFIAYYDWYEYCDGMSDKQKANLFDCIRLYTSGTSCIQPLPEIQFVWNKIKKQLDKHNEEYQKICKRNKENADKRWKSKVRTDKVPVVPVASSGYQSMLDTDTDTDTDNDTVNDNNKYIGYGETGIIKLTQPQYKKLLDGYSRKTIEEYILRLEEYITNTKKGKDPYTNHYLVLLKRLKKDGIKEKKVAPKKEKRSKEKRMLENVPGYVLPSKQK